MWVTFLKALRYKKEKLQTSFKVLDFDVRDKYPLRRAKSINLSLASSNEKTQRFKIRTSEKLKV